MPRDPSSVRARKVSGPSVSERKTCRGSEDSAGRERRSADSSRGKECLLLVLVCRSLTHQKMLPDYPAIYARQVRDILL